MNNSDTIAAIATPLGQGGIGIVRVSGAMALPIAYKIFKPKNNIDIRNRDSHKATYGYIFDEETLIDEVMILCMRAPKTYTREDVLEISCHGSIVSVKKILSCVLKNGCRLAEPGEFTKRAFLNGRIDLSQAEAVIDIINAKTERAHRSSLKQLEGSVSHAVRKIRKNIMAAIASIEASIDYPDADLVTLDNREIQNITLKAVNDIDELLKTANKGQIIKTGIKTAIVGLPNVGKSSLLNRMLQYERAIVTEVAGTTRDTLEESINIDGINFVIVDTAGIRQTNDDVEKIGISRSMKAIAESELVLVLVLLDDFGNTTDSEKELLSLIENKKKIILLNKADILLEEKEKKAVEMFGDDLIVVSAKTGQGMEMLYKKIKQLFFMGELMEDEVCITSVRHEEVLRQAKVCMQKAHDTVKQNLPEDFISIDLQNGYYKLGEITGESVTETLIDTIFSEFCLGK